MIKGYYLHSLNRNMTEKDLLSYGVEKKIKAQCKVFSKYMDIEEKILWQKDVSTPLQKIFSRLPFTAISEKWEYESCYDDASFIYFRKNIIDASIVRFFKSIKKHNPGCKIILEIPTYPYDKEGFNTIKDLPYKLKDRINRKKLHKYVDRITTFTRDNNIFDIKTIKLMNGIDFSTISKRKIRNDNNDLHMIAVAYFAPWHGYDRVIEGIGQYYTDGGKRNIVLHLVGNGGSNKDYKEIATRYKIERQIIFHGNLSGKNLDDVYDLCNLSLDVFGGYRKDYFLSSSLKSREYAAKGLPIISACKIDFMPDDYKYLLLFPNDDSIIDMNRIIEFFDKVYGQGNIEQLSNEIRDFAQSKCDINNTLQPVIQYILSEK